MNQVFISYSQKDRDFVQRLVADLPIRLPGIKISYDMMLTSGDSWADTIAAQIAQADVILAVLSPDYLASPWAQREITLASKQQIEEGKRFIPLVVRACTPSGLLALLQGIDFTQEYEGALDKLVWGISGKAPMAAKGEAPGAPIGMLDQRDMENLRREVHAAVELFKSRSGESGLSGQVAQPVSTRVVGKNQVCCFVIMPFIEPDLQIVYEDFVRPTLQNVFSLNCERGDDVFGSNIIMDDILKSIKEADVVLADLTRKNANVFYELGICHALGKPVLLLAQSMDDVPFDLRHRRVLLYEYSPRGCKRLESALVENMDAVLNRESSSDLTRGLRGAL